MHFNEDFTIAKRKSEVYIIKTNLYRIFFYKEKAHTYFYCHRYTCILYSTISNNTYHFEEAKRKKKKSHRVYITVIHSTILLAFV